MRTLIILLPLVSAIVLRQVKGALDIHYWCPCA